ncbi:Fungal-specific transcription factor domain-containing protein [Madurella fahalii]|uniref:Fungal-specific transcription factor domain-containing protein n=1 Tax=Madurella fahalii TaxID=1157608 RepID=A0ABQ0GL86_9PEZI
MDADMAVPAPASAPAPAPATPAGTGTIKLTEPRRRNRPALSCIQCRTRKIRCDRNEPCASCMKSKIVNCTYEEARRPKPRLWRLSPAPAADAGHPEQSPTTDERLAVGSGFTFREVPLPPAPLPQKPPCPSPAAAPAGRTPEPLSAASPMPHHADSGSGSTAALAERIRQLEQQLSDALKRPDHITPLSQLARATSLRDRDAGSKAFGASCLLDGDKLFPLVINLAKRIESEKTSNAYLLLQKCKALGRSAISLRTPTHTPFELGRGLPTEETARRLVEAYFRTFESVYRILHRPTFWQAYQMYCDKPDAVDPAFIIQLQLCMAIGTCFQDDIVLLRRSAAQWIQEAQVWLVSSPENSRVNFTTLQTMCLLHLARETCGIGGDLTWISAGSLLRTAMHLGLHRDPDHLAQISRFGAEMRRRLWATVLEIILQSSLDSGAPPLLALADFDTRPPSNYDDDQLADNDKVPSTPRPPGTFSQTTVQLALLRSFPVRLAIAQYVNHFNSTATYEETLKWNAELTSACRALSATLQPAYDPAGILPKRLSLFQLRLAEHMVHRFFLALNHPWLLSAHGNPAYYFARKMCVETSLKLYRAIATGSPAGVSGTASQTDDFTRLATCGYGAFRSVPTLSVLTICLELLWQVQEDCSFRQSMSIDHPMDRPAPGGDTDVGTSVGIGVGIGVGSGAAPRHELLEAAKYSIGWTERRIRVGETNIKGYLLYSALLSQVQALQRGASDAEVERLVLGSIVEDLDRCYHLMKDAADSNTAPAAIGAVANGGQSMATAVLSDTGSEWGRCQPGDAAQTYGFQSIFNLHDADFFIGS